MQGNWRWLNGELQNIDVDPGHKNDVKAEYPERSRDMQATYDHWWQTLNSRDHAAGHEIVIGSEDENPTTLTIHDISGEVAWNQDQVLAGFSATGAWEIEVAQNGEYEFALRRYPAEAGAPILGTISISEKLREFIYYSPGYDFAITHDRSKELPVASVSLKVGSFEGQKNLPEKAETSADYDVNANSDVIAVKFTAKLKAGITKLEASFSDEAGKHLTAPYYVSVARQ